MQGGKPGKSSRLFAHLSSLPYNEGDINFMRAAAATFLQKNLTSGLGGMASTIFYSVASSKRVSNKMIDYIRKTTEA